ncbi:MAG: TetR family transcriptional regulator C-terminal domain-containing protein [Ruminococcus sp.]|nr:TetR family transcriptional regulator C-terminal domain-containing protein [Ruminococcus sp.]
MLREEWQGKEDYCFVYIISGSLTVIRKWLKDGLKESPHEIASVIYQLAVNCLKLD